MKMETIERTRLAAREKARWASASDHNDARGLISVVIPTFNRLAMLQELLSSLESQSWHRLEIIVVDDGSSDGTLDLLERRRFRSGIEVIFLRQANRGPAAARNRGLSAARGEFVYFVDSDDLVLSDGLAALATSLQNCSAPYCLAWVRNVDRSCNSLLDLTGSMPRLDSGGIVGSGWPIHAALYRREVLERAGPFNEALTRGEDSEMTWRILSTSGPGLQIDRYIALRRCHTDGRISDDATPRSVGLAGYRTLSCFLSWAEVNGVLRPEVADKALRLLSIALVRMRAGGEGDVAGQVTALGHRMEKWGARPPLLFRAAETFSSPFLFRIILRALHCGRDVRNNAVILLALARSTVERVFGRLVH